MIKRRHNFDRYLLDNITLHICCLNAIAIICQYAGINVYERLSLLPAQVLQGEWWRVITFIFVPDFGSLFFALLALYFYYLLGSGLEHHWGKGKYNLFLLVTILTTVTASLLTGFALTNSYIFSAIFLAFAYLYPNEIFYLFFFLPVKAKWLAWLNLIFLGINFLWGGWAGKIVVLSTLLPLGFFFYKDMMQRIKAYMRRKKYERRK